ncbi:Acylpyruvase fahd1, mitochondrial [Chamberlinius hualienensis]
MPDKPLIFMKPTTAYIEQGSPIKFPLGCSELHHEVELGVVIGKVGANISEEIAMDYVGGYALALDMTARDLQDEAKKKGLPWTLAKGYDTSCPISSFIPKSSITDPHNVNLWLKINQITKQNGSTKDMHFKVPYLISYVSKYFTLQPGDLILTGTPAGVGPVKSGDIIEAGIEGIAQITFKVQ